MLLLEKMKKSQDKNKDNKEYCKFLSFLIFLFFVSFIIGSSCFFSGCNLSVTNYCPANEIFIGTIYDISIELKQCKTSSSTTKNPKYEPCYDVYAYARRFNSTDADICQYLIIEDEKSYSYAQYRSREYKIGKNIEWYKEKRSSKCFSDNYLTSLWYTGLIFLSLSGFFLIVILDGIRLYICSKTSKIFITDESEKV